MIGDLETLTEKEKETLRLLMSGHDAKSIARSLELSVYTVNDRLREARRKLGVSSSREAARLFAQSQETDPNNLGIKHNNFAAKNLGIVTTQDELQRETWQQWRISTRLVAILSGGFLMLSLVLAVAIFSTNDDGALPTSLTSQTSAVTMPVSSSKPASAQSAIAWLAFINDRNWAEGWRNASEMMRSQISQDLFTTSMTSAHSMLGKVVSRKFVRARATKSLPGAPDGDYELLEFKSEYEKKADAIDTVVVVKEGSGWKVAGFFTR